MEEFDYIQFEKNKVNGHYDFALGDGTKVSQWETPPLYYVEQAQKPGSPFKTYKEFYYGNKSLKIKGDLFYNFQVGTWNEYKENGELLKKTNEDEPFKFSIDDLSKAMIERGVDIKRQQFGVTVTRSTNPVPTYNVSYPVSPDNTDDLNIIVFDGVTGAVITKTVKKMTKN